MDKWVSIIIPITILIIIVIFGFIIGTCANYVSYGVKEGTVVDKSYHAAYTTTTYQTMRIGNTSTSIPVPQYHSESYQIKIQKEEGSKLKECWIEITAAEYEKVKIGDYYGT